MEVRSTPNQGLSLYATKSYRSGDIILDEPPTFIFAPRGMDQIRRVRSEFRGLKPTPVIPLNDDDDDHEEEEDDDVSGHKRGNKKRKTSKMKTTSPKSGTNKPTEGPETSCLYDLSLPPTLKSEDKGRFRGMLVAAACYVLFSDRDDDDDTANHKSEHDKDNNTNTAQAIQNLYAPSIDDDDKGVT